MFPVDFLFGWLFNNSVCYALLKADASPPLKKMIDASDCFSALQAASRFGTVDN